VELPSTRFLSFVLERDPTSHVRIMSMLDNMRRLRKAGSGMYWTIRKSVRETVNVQIHDLYCCAGWLASSWTMVLIAATLRETAASPNTAAACWKICNRMTKLLFSVLVRVVDWH
jgi:hypothetical protein